MLFDFGYIFVYYLAVFFIGVSVYPLSRYLFGRFWDRGYILAKILGIGVSSYIVWLLANLKVLPFERGVIIGVVTFLGILNWGLYKRWKKKEEKSLLRIYILEEVFFFLGVCFWSYVRGFAPDINGLEKFMDYGFVNSILRTDYFPAKDMWLSGENYINYYYFGHYICAFLTKLTGIKSEITYNLQLGLIFGLSLVGSFSLVSNFLYWRFKKLSLKIFLGGIVGSLLLNLGGNLHTFIYVLKEGIGKYWYPDATRFIPYTIHEFPSYSYIVADLHGHLSDIPFVLANIGLIFCFFVSLEKIKGGFGERLFKEKKGERFRKPFILIFFIGFFLAINYMTNSWDLPIYLALFGGSVFIIRRKVGRGKSFWVDIFGFGFLTVGFYLLFCLPFNFYFEPFFKGIALVESRSPTYMLLILWGYFYFFAVSFCYLVLKEKIKGCFSRRRVVEKIGQYLEVEVKVLGEEKGGEINLVDIFILMMILLSTFLILFPEFLYVKDIYIKEYHRANTMFKLTYQSFMMLSMVAGYTLVIFLERKKSQARALWLLGAGFLIGAVLSYSYFGVSSYYNRLRKYKGLDGIKYLKRTHPGDYEAILWLRENAKKGDVVLEAVGESYTDYGRISSYTGLQTVLGWPVHEWLWRGSYDEAGKRTGEVAAIYSGDLKTAKKFIEKYDVSYVIVGRLEKEKYQRINEDSFKKMGEAVFKKGEVKIYKVKI